MPSPWAWRDDVGAFARAAGPVSPTIRGQAINDLGSFLAPMQSFRLSGEDESPLQSPLRVDNAYLSVTIAAQPPVPPPPASIYTHGQPADDAWDSP